MGVDYLALSPENSQPPLQLSATTDLIVAVAVAVAAAAVVVDVVAAGFACAP